jgi:cytochrome c-type biogenesis protein CcmH
MQFTLKLFVLFFLFPCLILYAGDEHIKGQVTLAKGLESNVSPSDTVFIFARAEKGPRVPLAVYKIKVKDLPHDFQLDDSKAQIPMFTLSKFMGKNVNVVARISKSGDAMAQSGDLQGMSAIIQPGVDKIKVIIDKILP